MSKRTHVTTRFLQMHHVPARSGSACAADIKIVHERALSPTAYRDLYNGVGAPWLWYERSELPDNELAALIEDPTVSIYTLRESAEIVGYAELRHAPKDEMQILYFGLMPAHIGKGLGHYFLEWTVRTAFAEGIKRLWVHTCSLDHPRALAAYERAGFSTYREESGWVRIPEHALERQRQG